MVVAVARVQWENFHESNLKLLFVIVANQYQIVSSVGANACDTESPESSAAYFSLPVPATGPRTQQRHSLALHVSAHPTARFASSFPGRELRTVERHLTRGNVHVLHSARATSSPEPSPAARELSSSSKGTLVRSGGRYHTQSLNASSSICQADRDMLVIDLTIFNHAVGGLDKAIYARRLPAPNQTNVRAFRGFDGAHTIAVVRGVHIARFHARGRGKTPAPKRRRLWS